VGKKSVRKAKNNNNTRLIGIDNRNKTLKEISPMTPTQSEVFDAFADGDHLFLHGVAGTGKTFISLYLALEEIMHPDSTFREIQIIRSVVPTRDVGFLPGSEKQKIEVFEAPYKTIVNE